jgi:hypothetical protein
MSPTEIAHEVERQLGCTVDAARFAGMALHVSDGLIETLQAALLLPEDMTLADLLELMSRPELGHWRAMQKIRRDYFLTYEAELMSDDALVEQYVTLRQKMPPRYRWRNRNPEYQDEHDPATGELIRALVAIKK